MRIRIPPNHPRATSLRMREKILDGFERGVVATAGLIAHGRGEAFDYLLGEKTHPFAKRSIETSAALMLLCKNPTISVNGNSAVLSAEEIVRLAKAVGAKIEVNLFYRSREREFKIRKLLLEAGAEAVMGVGRAASRNLPEIYSHRRRVDPRGILSSDVVLVPLEDGDRTEILNKLGKKVIGIDLNPLSRTAQRATITIVDNIVRAMPLLIEEAKRLRNAEVAKLCEIVSLYNNSTSLDEATNVIRGSERIGRMTIAQELLPRAPSLSGR